MSPVSDTCLTVGDLMEGTEYNFRVIAVNKIGESQPSEKSKTVLSKDPFGKKLVNKSLWCVKKL